MAYCFTCGNKGLLGGEPCPECGMIRDAGLTFKDAKDGERFVSKAQHSGIPSQYQGVLWSKSVLEETHKPLLGARFGVEGGMDDQDFIRFCNNLEKIDSDFATNGCASKSVGIVAPAGMSKLTFAYSCMQKALQKGKTVAPILDTVELKRLILLACENPNYRLYKTISFDDYVSADVCFVTVTKSPARTWAYQIIQDLLDRRARMGLPTVFFSRFAMSAIIQQDEADAFRAYNKRKDDTIKLPTMIQYLKGVSR